MTPLEAINILKDGGLIYIKGGTFVFPERLLLPLERDAARLLSKEWDYHFISREEYLNALQNQY